MAHLCLNYILGKQFSGTLINQLMKRIINLYSWNFFIFFRVMNQSFIQNRHFVKQLTVRIFKNSINHAHLKTFSDIHSIDSLISSLLETLTTTNACINKQITPSWQ